MLACEAMRRVVVVGVVGLWLACRRSEPNVCDEVIGDPSHAIEHHELKTIEDCIAPPGGDECARLAKIVTAIPSLLPGAELHGDAYLEACRHAPPELRPCMLPSYQLEHAGECAKRRAQLPRP
jgi:hypothetical protein